MTLTRYGQREWITILAGGAMLTGTALFVQWYIIALLVVLLVLALLSFFRDPQREIPTQRGIMVSPADGKVSSIHTLEHYEPLGGPATCIRIFLSVLNVHVNRSPCHCQVASITPKPGQYMNALNPQSAEVNESNLLLLHHPTRRQPVAAVRQVSGAIARTIVCGVKVGDILQRGQRFGMIKFGSTTELYIPHTLSPEVLVTKGQMVQGGSTILARIIPLAESKAPGRAEADADANADTDADADEPAKVHA